MTIFARPEQLDIEWGVPARPIRPVHYLGNKLRLVDEIVEAVTEVAPEGLTVCDLFAGSGVVSQGLSRSYHVLSVDVQEFSRVLCAATVAPPERGQEIADAVAAQAVGSQLRSDLRSSLLDLLTVEASALDDARQGQAEGLATLLELGPLSTPKPSQAGLVRRALQELGRLELDSGRDTVVTRYFGGPYYSWAQAIDLDCLLASAHQLPQPDRDFVVAVVLATASEAVNSVGKQFAQPIRLRDQQGRVKSHLLRQTVRDRSISVFESFTDWADKLGSLQRPRFTHASIRSDYRDVLADVAVQFDAVYADPPYTRDHYSRFYHVLETMAKHDEPAVSSTMIRTGGVPAPSRGVYRTDRHQSDFSVKSRAPGAFKSLFDGVAMRGVPLVLSYSPYETGGHPRMVSVTELAELARESFRSVSVLNVTGVAHNKLNSTERHLPVATVAEVLLMCRP